jgi:hypothetical protein
LVADASVMSGDSVFGTLVVDVVGLAHAKDVAVRLVAKPGEGRLHAQHELTRQTLHTGELQPGRYELPFELGVPDDIASYSGELFDVRVVVEGLFQGFPEDAATEPVEIEVAPSGALHVVEETRSLTKLGGEGPGARLVGLFAVFGGMVGLFIGSVFGDPFLWIVPAVLAVLGSFVALAIVATARTEKRLGVRDVKLRVSPEAEGIGVVFEFTTTEALEIEVVVFKLVAREMVVGAGKPAATRRTREESVRVLEDEALAIGVRRELHHVFAAEDRKLPTLHVGESRREQFVEVVIDARGHAPVEVRVPVDFAVSDDAPVIATQRA